MRRRAFLKVLAGCAAAAAAGPRALGDYFKPTPLPPVKPKVIQGQIPLTAEQLHRSCDEVHYGSAFMDAIGAEMEGMKKDVEEYLFHFTYPEPPWYRPVARMRWRRHHRQYKERTAA
jgi:hypothetical protein